MNSQFDEFLKYRKITTYLFDKTSLQYQEILYLLYIINYRNKSDNLDCFFDCLIDKYNNNYNIIKNYLKLKPIVNKNDFLNILNKKKSIFLFEDIDLNNLNFYLIIWENLHC